MPVSHASFPNLPCTLMHSLTCSYTLLNPCHPFFTQPPQHSVCFPCTPTDSSFHTPSHKSSFTHLPQFSPAPSDAVPDLHLLHTLAHPSLTYVVPLTHFLAYSLQPSPIPSLASFPTQQQPLTCFQQESRSFLPASLQTSVVGRNLVIKKMAGSCFT